MSIYSKNNHRAIYESHFGPIPKDPSGRSFEIHHLDGNHSNNDINNLICVSIEEHFNIHYSQGDWNACLLIADRMKLNKDHYKKLGELQQGKNNPSYDHNVYTFYHRDGKIERCTQFELREKYKLNPSNLSEVIRGNQKSTKGWRMTTDEKSNMTGKAQPGCDTVYTFTHKTGIVEVLTQRQLFLKYQLPCRSGISHIVKDPTKSYKGWRIVA